MDSLKTLDLSATSVGDAGIRILMGEVDVDNEESKFPRNDGYRSNLEVLHTRFNNDLSVETLQLVSARAPKLKTLDLCYCDALDKDATRDVCRDLKRNGTSVISEYGQMNEPRR